MRRLPGILFSSWLGLFAALPASAQFTWSRAPENPLIPGWVTGGYALSPAVLDDGDGYRMWFTGKPYGGDWLLFAASSADGVHWDLSLPPVLVGSAAPWESDGVVYAGVVREGSGFRMAYTGVQGCCGSSVGVATSRDGVHWDKYAGNPVLGPTPGAWDENLIGSSKVLIRDGSEYRLYYEGRGRGLYQTGLATSSDGVHWRKVGSDPVLPVGPAGSWDDLAAIAGSVFKHGGLYYMLYTGTQVGHDQQAVGIAFSRDGVEWRKHVANPVFLGGSTSAWDWNIGHVCALLRGDELRLWYSGYGWQWSTGMATAPFEIQRRQAVVPPTPHGEHELLPPSTFLLRQNRPNPFASSTTIAYELPTRSFVRVRIHDLQGREVATLVNESKEPGYHHVDWDGGHEKSGVYLCVLQAGGHVEERKLMLIR